MYRIIIGEISEEYRKSWNNDRENPYEVIEGKPIYSEICGIYGINTCQEHLRDEVPVDWGSWAFKGTRHEIEALFNDCRWEVGAFKQKLEEGKDYAVVFIEDAW